jgi:hypothetical protein
LTWFGYVARVHLSDLLKTGWRFEAAMIQASDVDTGWPPVLGGTSSVRC